MAENQDASHGRDVDIVTDEPIGHLEEFIRERPLVALMIAVTVGAILARRVFRSRPPGTA